MSGPRVGLTSRRDEGFKREERQARSCLQGAFSVADDRYSHPIAIPISEQSKPRYRKRREHLRGLEGRVKRAGIEKKRELVQGILPGVQARRRLLVTSSPTTGSATTDHMKGEGSRPP